MGSVPKSNQMLIKYCPGPTDYNPNSSAVIKPTHNYKLKNQGGIPLMKNSSENKDLLIMNSVMSSTLPMGMMGSLIGQTS